MNLLHWFDLLDMQLWPYPLCSRTQLDKLLLLNFQKGNNSLQVLYMDHSRIQRWVNLLDWFYLLDIQPWQQRLLYSRTQLNKLLLCYFQKGNNSLPVLYIKHSIWIGCLNLMDWFDLLDMEFYYDFHHRRTQLDN